jgi:hypothetical protein
MSIEPIDDASLRDVLILRRTMAQGLRDSWPGINQPYEPEDEDGD